MKVQRLLLHCTAGAELQDGTRVKEMHGRLFGISTYAQWSGVLKECPQQYLLLMKEITERP